MSSSVTSYDALQSLALFLGKIESVSRARGKTYFEEGAVTGLASGDFSVHGTVTGTQPYDTQFLYDARLDKWAARCSCPVGTRCKHIHALGLAWLDKNDRVFFIDRTGRPSLGTRMSSSKNAPSRTTAPHPANAHAHKGSFREKWEPIVAQKLGRSLTHDEAARLGALAALFAEFKNTHGFINAGALARHGFSREIVTAGKTPLYGNVVENTYTPADKPADPWELWQCLAIIHEDHGLPIPEVFRPMTDTASRRAIIEQIRTAHLVKNWRDTLARTASLPRTARAISPEKPEALPGFEGVTDLRVEISPDGDFKLLALHTAAAAKAKTARIPRNPWKPPTAKWLRALSEASAADLDPLPPTALALAKALREIYGDSYYIAADAQLNKDDISALLASPGAQPGIFLPDGEPWRVEPEPLAIHFVPDGKNAALLTPHVLTPDGKRLPGDAAALANDADSNPLYLFNNRVYRGPPPLPNTPLPIAGLGDPAIMSALRRLGARLPSSVETKIRRVALRPVLRCWTKKSVRYSDMEEFCARLFAVAIETDLPKHAQHYDGPQGWQWTRSEDGDGFFAPPLRGPDDPLIEYDLTAANAVAASLESLKLTWDTWPADQRHWGRPLSQKFPDELLAWRDSLATLPLPLEIEAAPELADLFAAPLRAHIDFSAIPTDGADRDWFDLSLNLTIDDTTLTPEEIALLLKARGKWVRLSGGRWKRIQFDAGGEAVEALDRLGLGVDDILETGKTVTHRIHALQLASETALLEKRDRALADALRERVANLTALPPPPLPEGLCATLRPYQTEGYHFLAHLSANNFGGVLADDMGLGKTVQALAWLLALANEKTAPGSAGHQPGPPLRALVICPKSVIHGWLGETARFAPDIDAHAFTPALAAADSEIPGSTKRPAILVANYAQLRANASWFQRRHWDAVILDEAQFIKNPASKSAAVARSLHTTRRLALTGTPVENRLLDLWSIFAFAQPGLLGTQAAFKRQHEENDALALARLRRRVRHFMLRRTKGQVATDLPPRTEDDVLIELDPAQRRLYDAELKRARAALLGIQTDRALDKVRFNILSSLLRLRQICCHPALIDPAHAAMPSEKLDALLERVSELRDEGHQVLVFSQFVTMLELVRDKLVAEKIPHLLLTGQTENRQELVQKFQTDRDQTVFLLSLKAAGFGLNLTAAAYVILFDPWWNPAVEAQAIDRAHRIGQSQPVVAYRLIAKDTVEEKIRALQKEKAALAASIVQEESLASVLDLESLKKILS